MLQNLFSTIFLHNRPVTPLVQAFSTPNLTNGLKRPRTSRSVSENRCIYTYSPLSKDEKDRSDNCKGEQKPCDKESDDAQKDSQKPPWPPFGPSPSCCKPTSDQTCTPPPPRNPNPFYNCPQPYINEPPPPPWCTPPKEVPTFCQMPHLPPLPPKSLMPDKEEEDSKAKKIDEKFNFNIFDECDDVLYAGGSGNEYYEELGGYFEPKYKNLEYYSYMKDSYSNMAVCLSRYHTFSKKW